MEKTVDVLVIGAGSAGLSAVSEIRKVTDNFLIANAGQYGTTCARVGCMPSKVLIHAANDFHRRHKLAEAGINGGENLSVDMPKVMSYVRSLRDYYVSGVMKGMSGKPDKNISGFASFLEPDLIQVGDTRIHAKKTIIATGSTPVIPGFWQDYKDFIITSDEIFELEDLPPSLAIIGLGVIGTELGLALSRLGVDVVGLDLLNTIAGITDPVILEKAKSIIGGEIPLWLGNKAELALADDKIRVTSGDNSRVVDKVLLSMGRRPNLEGLGLENIGVPMDDRKMPVFDHNTMKINGLPIYIAGDVVVEKAILHEASDEGRIAGYNAVHDTPQQFKRRVHLGICFAEPHIASCGMRFPEAESHGALIGEVSFDDQGRARAMRKNSGHLRLYACPDTSKILGVEMIAPEGEHLAHLIAWSIQSQQTVFDLLHQPYYHPVVEEGLRTAVRSLVKQLEKDRHDFEMVGCDGDCLDVLC